MPLAYSNRGAAYLSLGRAQAARGEDPRKSFARAIEDCGKALQKNREDASAYKNRGMANLYLGDVQAARGEDPRESYARAIDDCGKAVKWKPEDPSAFMNRGVAHLRLGIAQASRGEDPQEAYGRAAEDCGTAIKMKPEYANAYNTRGVVYLRLGDAQAAKGEDPREAYGRAVEDCGKALKLRPDFPEAFNTRGNAYVRIGNAQVSRGEDPRECYDRGLEEYRKALRRNPSSWQGHGNVGIVLEKMGRFAEAARAFEKALAIVGRGQPMIGRYLSRTRAAAAAPPWVREIVRASWASRGGDYARSRRLLEKGLQGADKAGAPGDPRYKSLLTSAHYSLAGYLSLASTGKKAKLAEPVKVLPDEAAALRAEAVSHLRKAFELGPLRDRPEFKALLAEWEEKLKKK
jgi:tetratricopeptide (TPR) repeat protein